MSKYINSFLFKVSHEALRPGFFNILNNLSTQYSRNELINRQNDMLKDTIGYVYKHVKYYNTLFKSLKISPSDILKIEDLQKLPILTKEIINRSRNDFISDSNLIIPHTTRTTGGTTGIQLEYKISNADRFLGLAILYRGWAMGGYKLADPMVMLGGSSLTFGAGSSLNRFINERLRNIRKLSSFDMSKDNLEKYYRCIEDYRPLFIRGYPSAINRLAEWYSNNKLHFPKIKAIFTTSEILFPEVKKRLQDIIGCSVYDGYGLNDGGISAFECSEHKGMHIDTERSITEVVDNSGKQITGMEGSILATSLTNKIMPLIRYDTGDLGVISLRHCKCGIQRPILEKINGRKVDLLLTPDGTCVHGWFFQHIFWKYPKAIPQYQIVQKDIWTINIAIIKGEGFSSKILDDITNLIHKRCNSWKIRYSFTNNINLSRSGKRKYIISEIKNNA